MTRNYSEPKCGIFRASVAQVFNLLYRRFEIGRASKYFARLAGCKPAIQQIANLRYGFSPVKYAGLLTDPEKECGYA